MKCLVLTSHCAYILFHLLRASVGVGVALMSYGDMEANQWRGKGFKMLHLYGDRLWSVHLQYVQNMAHSFI